MIYIVKFYLRKAPAFIGPYGYYSSKITVTYSPTAIRMNVVSQSGGAYSKVALFSKQHVYTLIVGIFQWSVCRGWPVYTDCFALRYLGKVEVHNLVSWLGLRTRVDIFGFKGNVMSAPLDLSHGWPSTQTFNLYWHFFSLESLIPYILDSSHPMPPPFIAPDETTASYHEYYLIGFSDLRLTQKCHFNFSCSGFWIVSPFHRVSLTNHRRLSCQSSPLEANMFH